MAVDGDVERVHRADQRAEQRSRVGHLADAALQALVERGEHARIEAGADHEQERLGVGLGAGDRGNGAVEQHGRDGAGGGGEADLVRQHVAGADGDDAERRVGADQGGGDVPDRAVAAGGDHGIVVAAVRGHARRPPRRHDVGGMVRVRDAPLPLERAHDILDQRRAGDAGGRIGDEEKAAAHVWMR